MESVVLRLLQAADYDVEKAQRGGRDDEREWRDVDDGFSDA